VALDSLETVQSSPIDLEKTAALWASGREIDWESLHQNEKCLKVPLPTYPFSKEKYWVGQPQGITQPPVGVEVEDDADRRGRGSSTDPDSPLTGIDPVPSPSKPENGTFLAELCQALEGERQGMIEKYLQDVLAKLLAFHPPEVPELHQGFFDMGMESVMVEQFRVSLAETFIIEIDGNALYAYPNISALSAYIVNLIPFSELELHQCPDNSHQEETGFLDELASLITDDIQVLKVFQAMNLKEVVSELKSLLAGN
jgi:acyl carrier protein